ncbi:type VII secretion target [Saccharothrix australiensis]|uniref:Excreted virulence factor EspC (Type VII ESX diderm) n=1 Tax=Saccharothrix australiensis TaxID=2072 RepID=A0A495VV50_9PSEU|nr:type VII secretion target [Saccharothrix australiensis]RKT53054.1 excreted virulence factor EspC (type VII ESX diderm) [Saccharothrix australiensis]
MNQGYQVLVEELRGHADRLRGVEDQLHQALDAARQVGLSGQAYGRTCAMLPPMMAFVANAGVRSLSEVAESVAETITTVKRTAAEYESVEQGNARAFRDGSAG